MGGLLSYLVDLKSHPVCRPYLNNLAACRKTGGGHSAKTNKLYQQQPNNYIVINKQTIQIIVTTIYKQTIQIMTKNIPNNKDMTASFPLAPPVPALVERALLSLAALLQDARTNIPLAMFTPPICVLKITESRFRTT